MHIMSKLLIALVAVSLSGTASYAQAIHPQGRPSRTTASRTSAPETPATLHTSTLWQDQAFQHIEQLAYGFKPMGDGYLAANDKNGLHCSINSSGYRIAPQQTRANNRSWYTQLCPESVGGNLHAIQKTISCRQEQNTLTYNYGAYDIIYENSPAGLRQNFLVRQKSEREDMLCVRIRINSSMKSRLENGRLLFSNQPKGKEISLAYDDLHVWDATGKHLPAYFLLSGDVLSIITDDDEAQYPITVDPLNHSPEWTTTANGLLSSLLTSTQINSSLYGYTVASTGDVNGDGYDDVAIGAPGLADVFSGTGSLASVGAVFVFRGSATGLSTTPSNILQPSSAVAGALFGYAIDAADATGDSLSDLLIGAPLDETTISVGGFSTATGSVGKAYLYSGASMSTSNPGITVSLTLDASLLSSINISNDALFGFSVAIADDMTGDGKRELVIGSPTYAGVNLLVMGPKTGAAFVYYSNSGNTFSSYDMLNAPSFTTLGILGAGGGLIQGLLFGYSVDGVGDYNGSGKPGVVVGAPAGVDLTSLGGLLTGQVLGGQAYVYMGTGSGISTSITARLQASSSGLLGSAGNLFGYKVKGLKTVGGIRNGSILVSAPIGGTVPNVLSLNVKTGSLFVFKAKTSSPSSPVTSDQTLQTPRSSAILQVLDSAGFNLLTGVSTDNIYDVNCDGYPDIVVGEPLSSSAGILALQVAATGGNAYVYTGTSAGLFNTTPLYTASASYDASNFSSVNAVALFGYSVAGVRRIYGVGTAPRMLVGAPSAALDFGSGLLNLGSTLGTLFSFTAGNNGPGKAYTFDLAACSIIPLPVSLLRFDATKAGQQSLLYWELSAKDQYTQFVVERSGTGSEWTRLGTVAATDHSSYQFTDLSPLTGKNLYRLRLTGIDGQQAYSPVATVSFSTATSVQLYPNPVLQSLSIEFPGTQPYSIRIIDALGRVRSAHSSAGSVLQLSRQQAGMEQSGLYRVEISSASETIIKHVLAQ